MPEPVPILPAIPADFILTIDGPAASGKSSVAQLLATRLDLPFVSSGLLYRAVTWAALAQAIELEDEAALLAVAEPVRLQPQAASNLVFWDNQEISGQLHSSAIDAAVSTVSRHLGLRDWVKAALTLLPAPFVIEGRDMGRVVFPAATCKLYITASAQVRALRRSSERPEAVAAIETALIERDRRDAANLAPAADAVVIDSSLLTLEQVVAQCLGILVAKVGQPAIEHQQR
jgi:CMP/dCMP kinase